MSFLAKKKHVRRPHLLVLKSEQEQRNLGAESWEESHFFQAYVWAHTTKSLTDPEQSNWHFKQEIHLREKFPRDFFPNTSPFTFYHKILLLMQGSSPEEWEMCAQRLDFHPQCFTAVSKHAISTNALSSVRSLYDVFGIIIMR